MTTKVYEHIFLPKRVLERVEKDGARHYVTPEGNVYPSVTTVLDKLSNASLDAWRAMVGEKEADEVARLAAGRGTALHDALEKHLLNTPIHRSKMMPTTYALYKAALPFLANINTVYALEHRLYSDTLRSAGTVDLICDYKGRPTLADFKTSSKQKELDHIYSYFIQVTAYAIMLEEMYGLVVDQLAILICCEDSPRGQEFIIPRDRYLSETKQIFQENSCGSESTERQKL